MWNEFARGVTFGDLCQRAGETFKMQRKLVLLTTFFADEARFSLHTTAEPDSPVYRKCVREICRDLSPPKLKGHLRTVPPGP